MAGRRQSSASIAPSDRAFDRKTGQGKNYPFSVVSSFLLLFFFYFGLFLMVAQHAQERVERDLPLLLPPLLSLFTISVRNAQSKNFLDARGRTDDKRAKEERKQLFFFKKRETKSSLHDPFLHPSHRHRLCFFSPVLMGTLL